MRTKLRARTALDATPAVVAGLLCAVLVLTAASPSAAQLTIVNPKQLEVPEEKGSVLLSTACQLVAQEFRVSDPSGLRFSLWDETKFAALAIRLCVQRLPTHEQEARLLKEILRRSDKISPVPANELRRDAAVSLPPPPRNKGSDCMSAVREQPCRNPNQDRTATVNLITDRTDEHTE